jgi:hypothetical protein
VAVLALVLGAGAVTAAILRANDDAGSRPSPAVAPTNSPPARTPLQQTVDLDPRTGYATAVRTSDAGRQTMTAQTLAFGDGVKRGYGGEVTVYDPGAFDPARLRDATPLTVRDHPASLTTDFAFPESTSGDAEPYRTEVIAWQDPTGVWVLVYAAPDATVSRDELLRFAATVTVGSPRDLRAPFHLGPLPAGLTPTYVRSADIEWDDRDAATIGLSAADRRPSDAAVYDATPAGIAVSITAAVRGRNEPEKPADFTIAGHDAWYTTGTNRLSAPGDGGKLTVATEGCTITVEAADRKRTPRAALRRMVEDMTIGDCRQPDTWIPPLS